MRPQSCLTCLPFCSSLAGGCDGDDRKLTTNIQKSHKKHQQNKTKKAQQRKTVVFGHDLGISTLILLDQQNKQLKTQQKETVEQPANSLLLVWLILGENKQKELEVVTKPTRCWKNSACTQPLQVNAPVEWGKLAVEAETIAHSLMQQRTTLSDPTTPCQTHPKEKKKNAQKTKENCCF